MKIAILGNGGREHALAMQVSKSSKLKKLSMNEIYYSKKLVNKIKSRKK